MQPSKKTYTISELSKEFGITPRSIRYYEDQKLISPERYGSKRIYSRSERIRLQLILRGKRIGFSLQEIREIITLYNAPSGEKKQTLLLLEKIKQRRSALELQQQDIETTLEELKQLENKLNQ